MARPYAVFTLMVILFSSLAGAKTTYILGVDGLSYEAFKASQARGLFKDIKSVSGHITAFPSMTDLSWSTLMHTTRVFGRAGRIQTVEAPYFDESSQTVQMDVRDYFRRLAQPTYYLSGFQNIFNPYIEELMYLPTEEVPKLEIKTVVDGMIGSDDRYLVTGYVGAVDSMAHTQKDRLFPVMAVLDREIHRLVTQKKAAGEDFELVLVSDHGNAGRFVEGQNEVELEPIDIGPVAQNARLNVVNHLELPNDIALPLLALGTWAPVYFKDRKYISSFTDELIKHPWFDMSFEVTEKTPARTVVKIVSARGTAEVIYSNKYFFYQPKAGNPLQIIPQGQNTPLTIQQVEFFTRNTYYPDSLLRLITAANSPQYDFPDLILTFRDGYYINNPIAQYTKMYRTHGSLSRRASLGIVASTAQQLPSYMRTEDVLPYFHVLPEEMFGAAAARAKNWIPNVIENARESREGIPTGAKNFSTTRIFQQLTKVVSNSRPFFVVDEVKSLLNAFGVTKVEQGIFPALNFDPTKLDAKSIVDLNELGALTDLVIKNPDMETVKNSEVAKRLQEKFKAQGSSLDPKQVSLATKRLGMKMYQIPYLLDQSFNIQERPFLPETRDLDFGGYWFKNRSFLITQPEKLNKVHDDTKSWVWKRYGSNAHDSIAHRLFAEVFKEEQIQDRISPEMLDQIYKRSPEKRTIVYLAGTYNGIFDQEIFSLGLVSLKEDLGLRVLKAPTFSNCPSEINGEALLNFLKSDQQRFIERKEEPPKYILIGYSKGAVDALKGFIKDRDFVHKNILGLVAVASPLKGSKILDSADLPFKLVDMLIDENPPPACNEQNRPTKNLNPGGLNEFWGKHQQELVGLTRYFSVSFVSTPEESHIFMKAAKVIGQYDEDNDGIVPLSASKFPEALVPIDLGQIEADHLAGILSSRFPQKAFFRAIVKTLAELGVDDSAIFNRINKEALQRPEVISPTAKYDSYLSEIKLPFNQLGYNAFQALDLRKMPELLANKKVVPLDARAFKGGVNLSFDKPETDVVYYRIDNEFDYESRTPVGADNNPYWGFHVENGPDKTKWLAMRSFNNSIRLTTLAYRFKISDFRNMNLKLLVTRGPKNADPVKGGSGKDDSAFQVWFTLRDLSQVKDRTFGEAKDPNVFLFGYYWGEPQSGQTRKPGQMFENFYSNKSYGVVTFPPSYELLLNSPSDLGHVMDVKRDIMVDVQKAFPKINVNQMEVVAITLQMDSNDTHDKSEAFLKTLKFLP